MHNRRILQKRNIYQEHCSEVSPVLLPFVFLDLFYSSIRALSDTIPIHLLCLLLAGARIEGCEIGIEGKKQTDATTTIVDGSGA
jgi:hypothetical protein